MENVVLITIDCLRADHVGCLGYDRNTTPNIDQIAEEGVLFEQAIAQGGRTATSFPSILTSTYPLMFGHHKKITRPRKTIAEVLKNHEFSTAGFHANPSLSRYFNYDRGFETFKDFVTDSDGERGAEKGFLPNFELKGDFRKKSLI